MVERHRERAADHGLLRIAEDLGHPAVAHVRRHAAPTLGAKSV
jgi:hypothetical protein